jgi:tRNA-uridine 2-sulfurtransferase
MSGGVDSSVAAALLLRDGYDVVGCFMRLGSPGETLDELISAEEACDPARLKIGHQGCCSINDAADARLVAAQLGIPFYVCNFKKDFGRIIDYFVDEYAAGRTPNPCVRCNDWLKFGKLHDYAQQIGADFVASGHYARISTDVPTNVSTNVPPRSALRSRCSSPTDVPPGSTLRSRCSSPTPSLLRGLDHTKDQSYVLFGVPRDHLSRMLLPIGHLEKPAVRQLAREFNLPVFDKPDSQEICFVPDNDYAGLVDRRRPELNRPGQIIDEQGSILGAHAGQHRFTIGQRRGVGIGAHSGERTLPLYVIAKDPAANTITVGPKERLLAAGCTAGEANWLVNEEPFTSWRPVFARYRYNAQAVPAEARLLAPSTEPSPSGRPGRFEIRFREPQTAVAPGQALVLYDEESPDLVLGGGWIMTVDAPA